MNELWQRGVNEKLPKFRIGSERIRTRVLSVERPTLYRYATVPNKGLRPLLHPFSQTYPIVAVSHALDG